MTQTSGREWRAPSDNAPGRNPAVPDAAVRANSPLSAVAAVAGGSSAPCGRLREMHRLASRVSLEAIGTTHARPMQLLGTSLGSLGALLVGVGALLLLVVAMGPAGLTGTTWGG